MRRDGLEVYSQLASTGDDMFIVKARCTIYRPAHAVLRAVSTPALKLQYDATLAACHVVREFDETFKIVKYHFRSPSIVAKDRDAIWCVH